MIINGKEYVIPEIDFNMICDLEDRGVSILQIEEKPISSLRAFLSVVGDIPVEQAGQEIQEHIIKGGEIEPVITEILESFIDSGFFRQLLSPEDREMIEKETENIENILNEE